jgi:hypothetical protein
MSRTVLRALLRMSVAVRALIAAEGDVAAAVPVLYLEQGWSREERQRFYYTTQGSQLIPYDWFLALEKAGSQEPFAAAANLGLLRRRATMSVIPTVCRSALPKTTIRKRCSSRTSSARFWASSSTLAIR